MPGPTIAPQPLDADVQFGTGVVAWIDRVEAVEVVGRYPGERSGPGVVITVAVENGSEEAISLDFVTVDLIGVDGSSATPVEFDDPSGLFGDLSPGSRATGRYQYFIPVEQRSSATITVSYAAGVPTALFIGELPDV